MSKSRLTAKPIFTARKRKPLAKSEISGSFIRLGRFLMPLYLRFALSFSDIEIREPELIAGALDDFREKKTRLIAAFRHPYGDEPQLFFHVFENMIPRYEKKQKKQRTHVRFLHDYAVPLWGGAFIRFILPRAGAVPVYHVKYHAESMKKIRSLLRDGPWPVGIAPEGQISYHSETLPRIEPGTAHLGLRCADEIEKAGRSERVMILPLSVHYRYENGRRDIKKIRAILERTEVLCGMAPSADTHLDLQARTDAIGKRVLDITEDYYARTYGYRPPDIDAGSEMDRRQQRWNALLPAALDVAEHILGIDPERDDIVQRMYKVRMEGWNRVLPEDLADKLSPIDRALAQRRAGEGWFAMRHMEFVDLMSYHDVAYLTSDFDRAVETVLNLADLVSRLMGGNISNRPNNLRKKAVIVPGPCLDLTEMLPSFRAKPRQAVRDATNGLARRFTDCIQRYQAKCKTR